MRHINAVESTDGRLFRTEEECKDYELSLRWRDQVSQFVNSGFCPYQKGSAQVGMAYKIIVAWESFKESQPIAGSALRMSEILNHKFDVDEIP